MQEPTELDFVSVAEAATILGLHDSTVRRMIYSGKLRAYRAGGKAIRIPKSALTDVLEPAAPWAVEDAA